MRTYKQDKHSVIAQLQIELLLVKSKSLVIY